MEKEDSERGSRSISSSESEKTGVPKEPCHSHISSLKTSARGASATSDSAYGGSNTTQSHRSGSGKGSHSSKSKSQVSSNSSSNAAIEQPKARKEKDPKKRKFRSIVPPIPADVSLTAAANTEAAANSVSSSFITSAEANPSNSSLAFGTTPAAPNDAAGNGSGNSVSANTGLNKRKKIPRVGGIGGIYDSRVAQAGALNRALNCLKDEVGLTSTQVFPKLADKETLQGLCAKEDAPSVHSVVSDPRDTNANKFAHFENVTGVKKKDAFIAVISLHDGVVVHVTSSMTDKLGYQPEMWLGRSLLDFLHPKDRLSFTNQITSKLLTSLDKDDSSGYSFGSSDESSYAGVTVGSSSSPSNIVCSRLRFYRGLRTIGFGIFDQKTSYLPFRISLNMEKFDSNQHSAADKNPTNATCEYFLVAYAVPISTAYKSSEEKSLTGHFDLRHSAGCLFSEMDMNSIPYLGHLPQDLLGTSALDFYHPGDLQELKNVYNSVISRQGKSVRSKPYNFRAFNGCYVLLETDWTCFINPWTKKLEFVAGHNRVLKGPSNPDVFANPPEESPSTASAGDSLSAESVKKLQEEICCMLTGTPKRAVAPRNRGDKTESVLFETKKHRRKSLATLMGSLIDEVAKVKGSNSCGSCVSKPPSPVEGSLLGDASVVMGDISTHGESAAETSSGDTPISYSMLNYNQNLERYFQSQPKMMPSDGSRDSSPPMSGSDCNTNTETNTNSNNTNTNTDTNNTNTNTDTNTNSDSKTDSKTDSKADSNSTGSGSQNDSQRAQGFKGLPLTKEMLGKHNEEMEKEFMQHHRDMRNRSSTGKSGHGRSSKAEPHGVKRGQAGSWGEHSGVRYKMPHTENYTERKQFPFKTNNLGPFVEPHVPTNLLPPFPVNSSFPCEQLPSTYSVHGQHRNVRPSPSASVNQSNQAGYYLNSGTAGRFIPGTLPVGSPFMVPPSSSSNSGSLHMQAFPYFGGVIYQQMMPMLFQPDMQHPYQHYSQQNYQRNCFQSRMKSELEYEQDAQTSRNPNQQTFSRQKATASRRKDFASGQANQNYQRRSDEAMDSNANDKKTAPWMNSASNSCELKYQYQLPVISLTDVLEADRKRLGLLQQPGLLNNQLNQLYSELEMEERTNVELSEGTMSSSSSNNEAAGSLQHHQEMRRQKKDFRRTWLYDENAPFPQPTFTSTQPTETDS